MEILVVVSLLSYKNNLWLARKALGKKINHYLRRDQFQSEILKIKCSNNSVIDEIVAA